MGVVQLAFVIIGENLVGLLCSLEADLGFCTIFLCDLVGMMCECSLSMLEMRRFMRRPPLPTHFVIGFFDLDLGCALFDLKDLCLR